MIICSRCGKLYDYEKHNGICPQCCRYNRKDSSAEQEAQLHKKYDSSADMHTEEYSHYKVHADNGEKTGHAGTAAKKNVSSAKPNQRFSEAYSAGKASAAKKQQKKKSPVGAIAIIVLVILWISMTGILESTDSGPLDWIERKLGLADNTAAQTEVIDDISLAGNVLSDDAEIFADNFELNEEDLAMLDEYCNADGYFILELDVYNDIADDVTLDLSETGPEDLTLEGEYADMEPEYRFSISDDMAGAYEYGCEYYIVTYNADDTEIGGETSVYVSADVWSTDGDLYEIDTDIPVFDYVNE